MKYTSQHCCEKKIGQQNDLMLRMLFSDWYKTVVNKVNFVCFGGAIAPLDPPLFAATIET